jgi:hypothetical protein
MKNPTLLTDADGVLFDWFAGFCDYIREKQITTTSDSPSDWHLHDWLGVTPEQAAGLVE